MAENERLTRNHYNIICELQRELDEHSWCRRQTVYDSSFIAHLHKRLQLIANQAYEITQIKPDYTKTRSQTAREIIEDIEPHLTDIDDNAAAINLNKWRAKALLPKITKSVINIKEMLSRYLGNKEGGSEKGRTKTNNLHGNI